MKFCCFVAVVLISSVALASETLSEAEACPSPLTGEPILTCTQIEGSGLVSSGLRETKVVGICEKPGTQGAVMVDLMVLISQEANGLIQREVMETFVHESDEGNENVESFNGKVGDENAGINIYNDNYLDDNGRLAIATLTFEADGIWILRKRQVKTGIITAESGAFRCQRH